MKKYSLITKKTIDDFSYYDLESTGEIENIDVLKDFIEDYLIEIYSKPRKKLIKNNSKKDKVYHSSIALSKIINIDFCKEEFDFVMNYLDQLGVIVSGYDTEIIGLFKNYECVKEHYKLDFNICKKYILSDKEIKNLFKEYHSIDDKKSSQAILIRNKIVEANLRLVNLAIKYVPKLLPLEDLNSYGYLCLITAVEQYNPSLGYSFATYADNCIRMNLIKKILKEAEMENYDYYRKFLQAKNVVDKELADEYIDINNLDINIYLNRIFDELGLDEESLKIVPNKFQKSLLKFKYNINRMYHNYLNLDCISSTYIGVENEVQMTEEKEMLHEALEMLSNEERKLVYLKYGFYDEPLTFNELEKIFNKRRQILKNRCTKAKQKIKTMLET